jgi:hypothetical protein
MAFKVTWNGHEPYDGYTMTFQPGESRYFKSREHIPHEILMDYRFHAVAVSEDEAFPPEIVGDSDSDERARGTIPRFTEVPTPEDDSKGGADK